MGKTIDLRTIITTLLDEIDGTTYYEIAPSDAVYPYKVYEFELIDTQDVSRDDNILTVHVWGDQVKEVEQICDDIEDKFRFCNASSGVSYPTFYTYERRSIPDENKALKHRQLKILINNYYIGE